MASAFARYTFAAFDRPSGPSAAVPSAEQGRHPLLIDLAAPDAEARAEPEEARREAPPDVASAAEGPPAIGRAELEAAVREAEDRTRLAVQEAADARIEHRLAEAVERLAEQLATLQEVETAAASRRAAADAGLALGIARSIVPQALARAPLADLEAMLVELLEGLESEPRLELRLAPDLIDAGRDLIHEVAERAGWKGAIEVGPDARLAVGDGRLIWTGGRAERRLERITAKVEEMLASRFTLPPPDAPAVGVQATDVAAEGEGR